MEVQKEITSMQLSYDGAVLTLTSGTQVPEERICIELMTSDRKLKASSEGSK